MNTNQDIPRCLGVGTQGKNFGVRCTRYAARKYIGYCNSHYDQAPHVRLPSAEEQEHMLRHAIVVAQDVGGDLMTQLEASFNETGELEAKHQLALSDAQKAAVELMTQITISFKEDAAESDKQIRELKARNKELEEQTMATEREVDLRRELENEKSRSERLEYSLASALIEIERLKISAERLRLLEASM